jgi:cysteine synthase
MIANPRFHHGGVEGKYRNQRAKVTVMVLGCGKGGEIGMGIGVSDYRFTGSR